MTIGTSLTNIVEAEDPNMTLGTGKMHGNGGWHKGPQDVDDHRQRTGALEADAKHPERVDSSATALTGAIDAEEHLSVDGGFLIVSGQDGLLLLLCSAGLGGLQVFTARIRMDRGLGRGGPDGAHRGSRQSSKGGSKKEKRRKRKTKRTRWDERSVGMDKQESKEEEKPRKKQADTHTSIIIHRVQANKNSI
jgi:hypothetical protein